MGHKWGFQDLYLCCHPFFEDYLYKIIYINILVLIPNYWTTFKISIIEKMHLSCKNSITDHLNIDIMFIFRLISTCWALLYTTYVLGTRDFGQPLTAWAATWDCEMTGRNMQTCNIYLLVKDPESFGAGYIQEEIIKHIYRWGCTFSKSMKIFFWNKGLKIWIWNSYELRLLWNSLLLLVMVLV